MGGRVLDTRGLEVVEFWDEVTSTGRLALELRGLFTPAGLMTSGEEVSAEEEQLDTTSGLMLDTGDFSLPVLSSPCG